MSAITTEEVGKIFSKLDKIMDTQALMQVDAASHKKELEVILERGCIAGSDIEDKCQTERAAETVRVNDAFQLVGVEQRAGKRTLNIVAALGAVVGGVLTWVSTYGGLK